MKKILLLFLCSLAPSYACEDLTSLNRDRDVRIEIQNVYVGTADLKIDTGTRRCTMFPAGNESQEILGSIAILPGESLAAMTSPIFDSMDKGTLPPDAVRLISVAKAIDTKNDFNTLVMLGDLYVPTAHRGKGYAKKLIDFASKQVFQEGIATIIIQPYPFEYEDGFEYEFGKEKSLEGSPDYQSKEQRLITLYEKCGFENVQAQDVSFMQLSNKKS